MRDLEFPGRSVRACAIVLGVAIGVAGATSGAWAQERPDTTSSDTTEHVVRGGDTLWDLAGAYYADPYSWPMIHEANFGEVDDPHWIYPRERLIIPGLLAGMPAPVRRRSDPLLLAPTRIARTTFWTPPPTLADRPTVISTESTEEAPVVRAGEFRAAPRLLRVSELGAVARFARPVEPAVAGDIARAAVRRYDEVLLSEVGGGEPEIGERLVLVRPGRRVGGWGRIVQPVAMVRVAAAGDDLFTAEVIDHFDHIEEGDFAVRPEQLPLSSGDRPQPVDDGPTGEIIEFQVEQPLYGVGDVAFLDLGVEDGVAVGDEVVVYLPPQRVRTAGSRRTPSEPIARLRVVRVTDRTATARVIGLRHPVLEPELPVRLVGKMP